MPNVISSPYIDALVAVVVVLVVFSSVVSLIVEYINSWKTRQKRPMYLYNSIIQALDDPQGMSWSRLMYDTPVVKAHITDQKKYPTYIASKTFCDALLTVVQEYSSVMAPPGAAARAEADPQNDYDRFVRYTHDLPAGKLKDLMRSFLIVTDEDKMAGLRKNIKSWFDQYQDRVTADFKKSTRLDALWVGVTLAIVFNINFVSIFYQILNNGTLRNSLIGQAEKITRDSLLIDNAFKCNNCEDQYDAKYQDFLNKRMQWTDTTVSMLMASGLPLGWEIPRSSHQLWKEYLAQDIVRLQQAIRDTTVHLRRKYCLVGAFFNGAVSRDTVTGFTQALLGKEEPDAAYIDSLVHHYKVKPPPDFGKEVLYFFRAIEQADTLRYCLSSAAANTAYQACVGDCSDIDRIVYINEITDMLHDRIRNDVMEIEYFDDDVLDRPLKALEDLFTFPWRLLRHNIRTLKDAFLYLTGTVLMGFLISASSGLWFQLLLRFFQVRLVAGPKPTR